MAEHPDDLVRDQYLMRLADRLAIDVDRLRTAMVAVRRPSAEDRGDPGDARLPPAAGGAGAGAPERGEVEALRVAVHEPALVADRLSRELFTDPLVQSAFEALAVSSTFHEALERTGGEARALLERLAVEDLPWGDDPTPYAISVLVGLVEAAAGRRLAAMVRAGDDRASELKAVLEELVEARSAGVWAVGDRVATQLLPWVLRTGEE